MELLNQELQLQTGETDVVRGLVALNVAQDHFERQAALRPNLLGSGVGTVATTDQTEATAFPTGVLRIDRLQFLDPVTSRPGWDLRKISRVGGHSWGNYWPYNLVSSISAGGRPAGY